MHPLKYVVLHCTALTAGVMALPAVAQTCADQGACLTSASSKVVQTLTPKVVPIFGDYPKLYIHDSTNNVDYRAPDDTRIAYDFYMNRNSFNLPSESSLTTTGIAEVDPSQGFTVLVVQKTRDNMSARGGAALTLLSARENEGYASVILGAQPGATGQKWSFGKSLLASGRPRSAYWQKPWDMGVLGSSGSFAGTEWVYYTFTPDGKVRVDQFVPYTYLLAFTAYQWNQALLDGGFPHAPYEAGGPSVRPRPVVFGTVGPWMIGAVNVPGQPSPTIDRVQAMPGFEGATIFSSPLSAREVVAYQNSLKGSYFLDVDMLPCNSGKFLSGTIRTPCGTGSLGSPPANVATVARAGTNMNIDAGGVILSGNDGNGASFTTIQAAIDALPATGGTIRIPPGIYRETLNITRSNVRLIGAGTDAAQVVITGNHAVGPTDDPTVADNPDAAEDTTMSSTPPRVSTAGTATVSIRGDDVYVGNLTIQNSADFEAPNYQSNGQAVALFSSGDRAIYRSVRLLGGQDTLYVSGLKRAYFSNCYIEGYVDYIFGNGKAAFDGCTLKTKLHGSLIGENTITAQKRESASEDSGFVFRNSRFLFDSPFMTNIFLGRPWGKYSTVYFLNSTMAPQVTDAGWIEFVPPLNGQPGTNNLPTSTYREYKTSYTDIFGQSPASYDIGKRENMSPRSNVPLTDGEAAALTPDIFLAGSDGWQPTQISDGSAANSQAIPVPVPARGVPNAPQVTGTVAGNYNVQVTWAGQPATPSTKGYVITARQHGKDYPAIRLPAYAYTAYVEVALNNEPVTVQVSEFNDLGTSAPSTAVQITPVNHDPSVPTNIAITPTATGASFTYDVAHEGYQPVFGGSIPHAGAYTALYTTALDAYQGKPIAGTSSGFTTKSWSFSDLKPDTTYFMSLQAYNGAWSPRVITSFHTAAK